MIRWSFQLPSRKVLRFVTDHIGTSMCDVGPVPRPELPPQSTFTGARSNSWGRSAFREARLEARPVRNALRCVDKNDLSVFQSFQPDDLFIRDRCAIASAQLYA